MSNELTILVVDDDPVIRTLLEKYLASGHKVLSAENGLIALDILEQKTNDIDLIFSDIEMPQLDGMALLETIRTQYPELCVIMISGSADTSTAVSALRKGAYDYISKPFGELEELDIIIKRWQQQQSLEAKLDQYASLHKEMMRNMKTRTFLAVDVAGSTKIKKGEDPFIVQYTFKAYQDFIAAIVENHRGAIHSTSGDGAMACFTDVSDALDASSQILSDLGSFNLKQSDLKRDFVLRIGIHTGQIIIKTDGHINEMFSESLDIAGHIQKGADKNNATISEAALDALGDTSGFKSIDKKIDGNSLYIPDAKQTVDYKYSLPE